MRSKANNENKENNAHNTFDRLATKYLIVNYHQDNCLSLHTQEGPWNSASMPESATSLDQT